MSLEYYKLDPTHFHTTPSLGWQALLKNTGVEFELFDESQSEMHRMVEMGIRGGVVNCVTRYAKANNKYMKEFDKSKISSFIKYLDENGLYAGVMRFCPLPLKNFEWMSEEDDWEKICEEEGKGCILEVDLEYPDEIHDKHRYFPLAPERGKKLIPNLYDKKFYVLHYRNLQCYLKQGLKLVKIHKGIKFDESCSMSPYIDLNLELRKEAKNEFEKDFFKLMNNAPFGKTMENVRNRVNIKASGTDEEFKKLVKRVAFKSRKILSEDLSLLHLRKLEVTLNKPIVLGMCILDLSKVVMIKYFYDYLITKYGSKVKLLYTDTDSLILWIQTEDFYMDIKDEVKDMYDTSNFSKDHPAIKDGFPVGINKKVLLMMKDESGGKEIKEFVGLGPKVYFSDEFTVL